MGKDDKTLNTKEIKAARLKVEDALTNLKAADARASEAEEAYKKAEKEKLPTVEVLFRKADELAMLAKAFRAEFHEARRALEHLMEGFPAPASGKYVQALRESQRLAYNASSTADFMTPEEVARENSSVNLTPRSPSPEENTVTPIEQLGLQSLDSEDEVGSESKEESGSDFSVHYAPVGGWMENSVSSKTVMTPASKTVLSKGSSRNTPSPDPDADLTSSAEWTAKRDLRVKHKPLKHHEVGVEQLPGAVNVRLKKLSNK